ncbi:PP2C family protein-serine/threonine phosphatase [Streptomyces sp. NPDC023723]|uniref:PP2C family protein-serine/threonine phosphatase n=1 Tax=Streptomyces sp. NPDC023723 TaxID=3154323 RepID=UPI0033DD80D9
MSGERERTEPDGRQWPARLHALWQASQQVADVTEMARHIYALMLTEPGVLAVTGTRWCGDELRYLRRATAEEPLSTSSGPLPGRGAVRLRPVPDAAAPPVVRLHDLSAGPGVLVPEESVLTAAGARWALEARFGFGGDDWAAICVGLRSRPELDGDLVPRLVQLTEVLIASHRRIMEQREHERRQTEDALLAEASLQMDSSLDVQETLGRVARLAVPAVAEGCVVHLFRSSGRLAPVASAHVAATAQPWLDGLARDDRWLAALLSRAVDRDENVLLSGAGLDGGPFGPDARGPGSAVRAVTVNALRARGKAIGTLTFTYQRAVEDVASPRLLRDLALRAALAIDTTTAYEQRRRHVELLQNQLLPRALPAWPGVELHSAYAVADDSLDVGGDFYDAVVDRDGRLALVIGDVCGRGAEAAAMTGLARHTLRTLLEDGTPPANALDRLNAALLDQSANRFVTALVALLTPSGRQECSVEVVTAGHPRPLVRRAGGRVEEIPGTGVFLGVVPDIGSEPTRLKMSPGDTLVMFTDGLTEARSAEGTMFEELLPAAVAECAERPDPAGELIARAAKFRTTGNDDTAVLVARLEGQP